MESTTYMLIEKNGKEHGLITGDTLFIGDVGRPDLAQHVMPNLTEEKLAGLLFDSLRNKIMPLSDDLIIYPNHGAGSACGKMMSKETTDTLGHQKKVNYALNPLLTKPAFIKAILTGLTPPPGYFPQNVLMNIQGYESLDSILERAHKALTPEVFEAMAHESNILVLDTRNATHFANAFIPNSINIGLDGHFAQWVGEMIPDVKQPILLIADEGKEEEAMIRLSRVGYDGTIGYLQGGFESWKKSGRETDSLIRITARECAAIYEKGKTLLFDVRKKSEFMSQHIQGAINIPLNEINQHLGSFPKDRSFIIHCAGGYRSMIASSILRQRGWTGFADVIGGFAEMAKTGLPMSTYECATSML
jgi:hydroxyacylglutathione hydrolase